MKLLISICTLAAVLAAGPASATQARRYIDADHRAGVVLPADHGKPLVVDTEAGVAFMREPAAAEPPSSPERQAAPQTQAGAVSAVPEPSGIALLCCGLLLLVLAPGENRHALFALSKKKPGIK